MILGACSIIVIIVGNGDSKRSSNPGQICILLSTNLLNLGMTANLEGKLLNFA